MLFLSLHANELLYAEVDYMQTWNILGANQLFCANHVNNYDDFLKQLSHHASVFKMTFSSPTSTNVFF